MLFKYMKGRTMMSQKRLDQWMTNQTCKFDDLIDNREDQFRWSETMLNIETNTINNLNGFEKLSSLQ